MFFAKSLLFALAPAYSALATITITGPSASLFWVQFTSNNITWQFSQGDPNPIDITVTNSNSSFLNGAFSIARNVDLSNGTFTVTNVTLNVASGYVVNFVNGSNASQIFASSGSFAVMPNGTAPATQSSVASSTSGSASGSGASSTGTASGTTSSSGSGSSTSPTASAAQRSFEGNLAVIPVLASAGVALLGALIML